MMLNVTVLSDIPYFLVKISIRTIITCTFFFYSAQAQIIPLVEWQKTFGGSSDEHANSIHQTSDGGFIVAGWTLSNDGDVSGYHGSYDYWIVKLDTDKNIAWQKCYGGSEGDIAYDVQETYEGGFVVAGEASSVDGDVTGGHGLDDVWIIKLSADGDLEWEQCLGGSNYDDAYSICQTADSGFIVAARTASTDGDVMENHGGYDYWILKLAAGGNVLWQKSLGGSADDKAHCIDYLSDGGFIVTGYSDSNDGDVSGNHGLQDYWVVRLDSAGNIIWQQSFGGSDDDLSYSIQQTAEGGFIAGGSSRSIDGDIVAMYGHYDFWIIKLDGGGNLTWQKNLGGSEIDYQNALQETSDHGFIFAGWSYSADNDVTENKGLSDCWVVKLDSSGNISWQKSLGGSIYDQAYAVEQIADNEFIVAGYSQSTDGDVSLNHGSSDFWIVKLTIDIPTVIQPVAETVFSLFPDPAQGVLNVVFDDTLNVMHLQNFPNPVAITVYDLNGRKLPVPVTYNNKMATINTTLLSNGIYTLQIIDKINGISKVSKFVRQE